jgi:23S rRNA pseudouridine1911/1915/1917 synthase
MSHSPAIRSLTAQVPEEMYGRRLDQALAELFDDYSRGRLQEWIKQGEVRVNDQVRTKPKEKLRGGERISIRIEEREQVAFQPQAIPLDILFEDEAIIVINKPAGLVVHPAAGNPDGTLQNALLHHDPTLAGVPRAGIVHRLDKDTSGVLVVARGLSAHHHLVAALQARKIKREYLALAQGVITAGGRVDQPVGRHPTQRTRMAVVASGKPAVTHYRVLERLPSHTLLQVNLETGRTHQIRVHMAWLRHPLAGDPVYGGRLRIPANTGEAFAEQLRAFRRQALHAHRLGLAHPLSGAAMEWCAPIPDDLQQLLEAGRAD